MLISRDGNAEASCSTAPQQHHGSTAHRTVDLAQAQARPRPSLIDMDGPTSLLLPIPFSEETASSWLQPSTPAFQSTTSASSLHARYFVQSPSEDNAPHPRRKLLPNIPSNLHSMTAGAGAGLVSSFATCPLDVIKTRLQAQHVSRNEGYEGVSATIKRIWQQSGVRGFYRGLGPTLGGYLPTWGIYFTVYDLVKDRLGSVAKQGSECWAVTRRGQRGCNKSDQGLIFFRPGLQR
jgi:hypothetical protein